METNEEKDKNDATSHIINGLMPNQVESIIRLEIYTSLLYIWVLKANVIGFHTFISY